MNERLRIALPPLAACAAALSLAACTANAPAPQAPPPPPVVAAKAARRTVPFTIGGIGNVEPIASVAVRSRVAGQIVDVKVADGADVSKGQALFTIDPAPYEIALSRAEAQLARDKALLDKARSDAARYAKLVEKDYVTREQYESATSLAASLAATIEADEAAAKDARLSLSYCTIAAPIAGRAGNVNLRAGNLVKASDDAALLTILQVRPIHVVFTVPEKYLSEVRTREAAGRLAVRATPRGQGGGALAGALVFIDNAIDATTGSIKLKAEFDNADRALWPGQFVEAELVLFEQKDAVVVPSTALQVGQQGSYVLVVGADGTAQLRPVKVDRAIGDETVLASGLDGGETVIVDGQLRVVPGAKVSVGAKP